MNIVTLAQGTQAWLDWRRSKRTASETPTVTRMSPYQTWEQLRAVKRGANTITTKAMQHGHNNENHARLWAEAETGLLLPAAVVEDGDYAASLDGLCDDVLLEIKCPHSGKASDTWRYAENGIIRADYAQQVQHQLMVTGCTLAYFVVYDAHTGHGLILEARPIQDAWDKLKQQWDEFWVWSQTDDPDPILDIRADREWIGAALDYASLDARIKELEAQKSAARQQLIDLAGDSAKAQGAGVTVSRIEKQGSVDWKKVATSLNPTVDPEPYRAKGRTEYRITL
jgi:putative phage-type endonuclease